jgi:hypothetical protein
MARHDMRYKLQSLDELYACLGRVPDEIRVEVEPDSGDRRGTPLAIQLAARLDLSHPQRSRSAFRLGAA